VRSAPARFIFAIYLCLTKRHVGAILVSLFLFVPQASLAEIQCVTWFQDALAGILEPTLALSNGSRILLDRISARNATKRGDTSDLREFEYDKILKELNESDELSYGDGGFQSLWVPANIIIQQIDSRGRLHFERISPSNFVQRFYGGEVTENAKFASKILDYVLHGAEVQPWIHGLKKQLINEMWKNGIQIKDMSNPKVREYFLDRVLARRAQAVGFSIAQSGMPFNLVTLNKKNFFRYLAHKRVFVDWAGAGLSNGNSFHYSRGHLLQMVYLAEHIPGFDNFIQHIGETQDAERIWHLLLDNARQGNTVYSGGWWVKVFGHFLGTRY
jgi:hypothetical protein